MECNNINKLSRELEALRLLKNDSSRLKHAVYAHDSQKRRESWVPFVPTRFMYSMFTFNMLYSINWPMSIECGKIIEFDSGLRNRDNGVPDTKKMSEYLKFCFSDTEFIETRKAWFCDVVLGNISVETMMGELSKIKPDRDMYGRINNNGNVRANSFIQKFRDSVYSVLVDQKFSEDNIHNVYNFIYKIRCNMFHGVKTITEMMDRDQQNRLEIYSRFLYAANSIIFEYLEYLNSDGEFEENEL